MLYRGDARDNCVIIQGAAFVVNGRAFPILGVGGIDFLDSLAQKPEVDGIIGNGNALFVARDFSWVYSAHTPEELIKCYEYETADPVDKFLERAPMGPLIFLLRSFKTQEEYDMTREAVLRSQRGKEGLVFEVDNTFTGEPMPFHGQSRLIGKFMGTTRVVHCARRPTLEAKECLFDSEDAITEVLSHYKGRGRFALVYTMWDQLMCDAMGMGNTRKLAVVGHRNPTDRITPYLLKMAQDSLNG